ncbi:dipeptide ABC transporter ATP-binding protein [Paenibacillus sp. LMG 31456]|uniref:Dipeptide ABC transporter ATP-binding protein n=1 Tax=Paenibacillus foliorum TaxID=2654974 RepID=A0A972K139_9BACL|nr:ABC transporter ATP-binding protein [Paenibacillus foliorum]NOU92362.1 dipeptide ABC transporter ATP-binding protein [Paenibacillus foliorum]
MTLLDIQHLTVDFATKHGLLTAITDVSLSIKAGETVCLVGESGSGKTVASKSIMRLIDYENGVISKGNILLDGVDLTALSQEQIRLLRGKKMAMVFQEPMAAFDPVFTIGSQIVGNIVQHKRVSKQAATQQSIQLLERVGIPEAELRMRQYPNELSGGMLQRAMIAMALSCEPELLIADEPTTAMDVTIQAQILQLLQELKAEYKMSILLITHDMGIAAQLADRIVVMYAGRVMEQASAVQLFEQPYHPYTKALLQSILTLEGSRDKRLYSIEGAIPSLAELPEGCRFHPRCSYATEQCVRFNPPLHEINGREVACWHAEELVKTEWGAQRHHLLSVSSVQAALTEEVTADNSLSKAAPQDLFEVKGLQKFYKANKGIFNKSNKFVRAVDDVSFSIRQGEVFGLVGESGSGKSTLGRVLLQLEKATAGQVLFQGRDLTLQNGGELRQARRDMQMIFQDPYGSLSPRWRVGDIIGEPLEVHNLLKGNERRARVEELLEWVGLSPSWYNRYPHEFSGGQRQRIGIARAIALNPKFILADEAVSALDVSVQSQIVNLLQDLQSRMGLTYLFIAHGLQIVRHISNRVGVMYLGKLVEIAPSEELFLHPAHHYTKALIASIPLPDPARKSELVELKGEIPSPANPPSGCRFHTRCPAATALCREIQPELQELQQGHWAACHYPV